MAPKYTTGPDGRPARIVGQWVETKIHHVDRYLDMFAVGMSKKWDERAYVELFAGPGLSWNKSTKRFLDGSAVRALQHPFTRFAFVDRDSDATAALTARTANETRPHPILTGDCNIVVDDVIDTLPRGAITLAFVDPTNWQVELPTIAKVASCGAVDILMTFFSGFMRRVWYHDVPALDRFFGDESWRAIRDAPQRERVQRLTRLYNEKLVPLGYLPDCWTETVPVRNSKNVFMYSIVLFTKHPRGLDFWIKAKQVGVGGQLGLFE